MNIGFVLGRKSSFGFNPKSSMDDFGCGYKQITELLRPHHVFLLSEFNVIGSLPENVSVFSDNDLKGLELDTILFGRVNANLLFNNNIFRLLYVLKNVKYKKAFEIALDTDLHFRFEAINKIEGNRLFNRDKLNMNIVSNYDKRWCDNVLDGDYASDLFLNDYYTIYNCLNVGTEHYSNFKSKAIAFPFSFLSSQYMSEWKPIELPLTDGIIYIGNTKPRLYKLLDYGIKTYLYGSKTSAAKLAGKYSNLVYKGRCKMSEIPSILPAAQCVIITCDPFHKNDGWILNRFLEAYACGVPCLFHEDVFFGDDIFGIRINTELAGFNIKDDDILWMYNNIYKDSDLRSLIYNLQAIRMKGILAKFDSVKIEWFKERIIEGLS